MRALYWILAAVVVILCVAGVAAYTGEKETQRAEDKAAELSQKLADEGLRVPDQDILVRTLGDDGGAVCEVAKDNDDGLAKAILFDQLTNGGSHVGRRPIIADRRVVRGSVLIVETYCPEEIEKVREAVEDLEFDDVIDG